MLLSGPLGRLSREQFAKFLSDGEIAGGAAPLLPVVPTRIAGLALAGALLLNESAKRKNA